MFVFFFSIRSRGYQQRSGIAFGFLLLVDVQVIVLVSRLFSLFFFFRYSLHNGSCGAAQIERDPFSLAVKSGKRLFTGSSAVSVARDGL